MTDQGVWHQAMVDGKQVWHFLPTHVLGAPKGQWELAHPSTVNEQTRTIVWKSAREVPLLDNEGAVTAYGKSVVLHAPGGSVDRAQTLIPACQSGVGYFSNCSCNHYNYYNYTGAIEAAAAAKAEEEPKAKEKAKSEPEGVIHITEDEVKLDSMLHEQAQAIRQLHYLHTVDYGVGDVYGRRYIR